MYPSVLATPRCGYHGARSGARLLICLSARRISSLNLAASICCGIPISDAVLVHIAGRNPARGRSPFFSAFAAKPRIQPALRRILILILSLSSLEPPDPTQHRNSLYCRNIHLLYITCSFLSLLLPDFSFFHLLLVVSLRLVLTRGSDWLIQSIGIGFACTTCIFHPYLHPSSCIKFSSLHFSPLSVSPLLYTPLPPRSRASRFVAPSRAKTHAFSAHTLRSPLVYINYSKKTQPHAV